MMKPVLLFRMMLLAVHAGVVSAEDNESLDSTKQDTESSQLDFSLGLGVDYDDPFLRGFESDQWTIDILLDFRYSYRRFFVETYSRKATPAVIAAGYTLHQTEGWQFNAIVGGYFGELSESSGNEPENNFLQGIHRRRSAVEGGFRSDYLFENSELSFEAVTNLNSTHKGWLASAIYSYYIPAGNWDFNVSGGLTHISDNIGKYYFGIAPDEALPNRPEFSVGASQLSTFSVHAEVPVSEDWVFKGAIAYWNFSDNLADSPLIESQSWVNATFGLFYVF
ncbi:MipA/OmpV family protein [Pleionea sp. CnH1-48]|uniref:MipA/OmpV family protein n=1 Tax=Pleionea sp. CnH1-48 TaxID=2954494 RepID=UPI002098418C|nr:MipA/OmpV family protein [Pleionea sp. CnH1-48]MCO7224298.1 MipA/OmpV family protein [Pleionea sp. CnH1-48]